MEPNNGGKTKIIILAILVILAIAVFVWMRVGAQPAAPSASTADESLSAIQNSATIIDTVNLDEEFQAINGDVNTL